MRRKIVIGLLCLGMAVMLLVGCSGNEGSVDEDVEMAKGLFPKESICVKI